MQELFESKIIGGQSCKERSIFPDPPFIQPQATTTAMQSLQEHLTYQAGTSIRSGHLQKYSGASQKLGYRCCLENLSSALNTPAVNLGSGSH